MLADIMTKEVKDDGSLDDVLYENVFKNSHSTANEVSFANEEIKMSNRTDKNDVKDDKSYDRFVPKKLKQTKTGGEHDEPN